MNWLQAEERVTTLHNSALMMVDEEREGMDEDSSLRKWMFLMMKMRKRTMMMVVMITMMMMIKQAEERVNTLQNSALSLSHHYQATINFDKKFRTFHLKKNFIAFLQIVSPHNQGRSGQTKELQGKKIFRKLAEVCVDVITAKAQVVQV